MNQDFINQYILDDEFCETPEEVSQLRSALSAAIDWGRKIDRENRKLKHQKTLKNVISQVSEEIGKNSRNKRKISDLKFGQSKKSVYLYHTNKKQEQ